MIFYGPAAQLVRFWVQCPAVAAGATTCSLAPINKYTRTTPPTASSRDVQIIAGLFGLFINSPKVSNQNNEGNGFCGEYRHEELAI